MQNMRTCSPRSALGTIAARFACARSTTGGRLAAAAPTVTTPTGMMVQLNKARLPSIAHSTPRRQRRLPAAAATCPHSPLFPPIARREAEKQDINIVGSSREADVVLPTSEGVAPQHAQLIKKGAQVFLLPLTGRDEDALATWSGRSGCFINGTEARSGVRYVLGNGSRLAFGSDTAGDYVVNFTESSGANPLVSLLMDGLAAGASPDVRDALKKL